MITLWEWCSYIALTSVSLDEVCNGIAVSLGGGRLIFGTYGELHFG